MNKDKRIEMLQYKNLREHFNSLAKEILGKDYYNLGMDVYSSDRMCCEDILMKVRSLGWRVWLK